MSLQSTPDQTVSDRLKQGWRLLTCPVWNHDTHRLRGPLRAFLPLVMTFLAFGLVVTVVRPRFDHPVRELVELGIMGVVLVAAVLASARLLDRRPVAEYGLAINRKWARSFVVGGLIATVANAGTMLVALAAGWATISGFTQGSGALPFVPAMLLALAYVGVLASWEEFMFRGAMLTNLAEAADGYLPRWGAVGLAVLLSTAVFAFMHSGKVGDPMAYGYYVVAGLIFGGIYVLSGNLALPIGFHVFYNFTMSAVFGLGASQQTPELIALTVVGPGFWIGEEGLVRVIFAVVGGVLLVAYVRWRNGHLGIHERITQWTPRMNRDGLDEEK
jgi:membrane protease YdiL (CAAX protease family)